MALTSLVSVGQVTDSSHHTRVPRFASPGPSGAPTAKELIGMTADQERVILVDCQRCNGVGARIVVTEDGEKRAECCDRCRGASKVAAGSQTAPVKPGGAS